MNEHLQHIKTLVHLAPECKRLVELVEAAIKYSNCTDSPQYREAMILASRQLYILKGMNTQSEYYYELIDEAEELLETLP